jgi:hypothetical protein
MMGTRSRKDSSNIEMPYEHADPHIVTMAEKHPKRPRDLNQWAKHVVDLVTVDEDERRAIQDRLEQKKKKAGKGASQNPGRRGSKGS